MDNSAAFIESILGGHGFVDHNSGERQQLWINLTEPYPDVLYDAFNPNHNDHGNRYHLRWFSKDAGNPNEWNKSQRVKAGFRIAQPQTPKDGWSACQTSSRTGVENLDEWLAEACPKRRLSKAERPLKIDFRPNTQSLPHRMHSYTHLSRVPMPRAVSTIRLNSAGTPLGAAEQFFAGLNNTG